MNILITNIGNRNIKYEGKLYSDLETKEKRPDSMLSFRDWTKHLLDNFESEKERMELNILDTVLNQWNIKLDKVFIVVSNQENNSKFNGQDTLYEGEIIKNLIVSNYQIEDVELKELIEDVTNENYLMRFYQQFYADLLVKYKDADFIFCDAGGTGQQKAASKIMAEFMFPDSKWKIVYPKKDGSVEAKTQIEYRNIINKEQAIVLVKRSQYEAALNILGGNVMNNSNNRIFNILIYAHYRVNRSILKWTKGNDRIKNYFLIIDSAIIKSGFDATCRNYSKELYSIFKERKYLFLSEALLVAHRKFLLCNYQDSILDFAVFYEKFIDASIVCIEKEVRKKYTKPEDKDAPTLQCWVEDNLPDTVNYLRSEAIRLEMDYRIDVKRDIPTRVHIIAEQKISPDLQPLAKTLLPYLDFSYSPYKEGEKNSLREVRNKLAHEGKYIDKLILDKELPDYEKLLNQCLDAWGLQREDIYEQLNEMIERQIRNS